MALQVLLRDWLRLPVLSLRAQLAEVPLVRDLEVLDLAVQTPLEDLLLVARRVEKHVRRRVVLEHVRIPKIRKVVVDFSEKNKEEK